MYTYTQTFIGVPLSQVDDYRENQRDGFKELLRGLTEYESIDSVLELDIEEYSKSYQASDIDKQLLIQFIDWIKENEDKLGEFGYYFSSSYNGGGDYPQIFGFYVGIGISDIGAGKIDTSSIYEVLNQEKETIELWKTLPKELVEAYPPFGEAGFWSNEHSS